MSEVQNAVPEIVINGVTVVSIADYAKRRHLKPAFVKDHMIKGDDQNPRIEPVYMLNRTGMYSLEELDKAYLERGSKGITLASMGYAHPGKVKELESRILELINEKREEAELRLEVEANLTESETELEQVKAQLFRAQKLLDSGQEKYAELMAENCKLQEGLKRWENGHHN